MGKGIIESSDLREAIYALADDLNQLVSREHQILQDELGQVSTIVGDAIKMLVESFNSLNEQVVEQEIMVQTKMHSIHIKKMVRLTTIELWLKTLQTGMVVQRLL